MVIVGSFSIGILVDKQIQDAKKKYLVSVNIISFEEFGLSVNEYCRNCAFRRNWYICVLNPTIFANYNNN